MIQNIHYRKVTLNYKSQKTIFGKGGKLNTIKYEDIFGGETTSSSSPATLGGVVRPPSSFSMSVSTTCTDLIFRRLLARTCQGSPPVSSRKKSLLNYFNNWYNMCSLTMSTSTIPKGRLLNKAFFLTDAGTIWIPLHTERSTVRVVDAKDLLKFPEGSSKTVIRPSWAANCFFNFDTATESYVKTRTFNCNVSIFICCTINYRVVTSDLLSDFGTLSAKARTSYKGYFF